MLESHNDPGSNKAVGWADRGSVNITAENSAAAERFSLTVDEHHLFYHLFRSMLLLYPRAATRNRLSSQILRNYFEAKSEEPYGCIPPQRWIEIAAGILLEDLLHLDESFPTAYTTFKTVWNKRLIPTEIFPIWNKFDEKSRDASSTTEGTSAGSDKTCLVPLSWWIRQIRPT